MKGDIVWFRTDYSLTVEQWMAQNQADMLEGWLIYFGREDDDELRQEVKAISRAMGRKFPEDLEQDQDP